MFNKKKLKELEKAVKELKEIQAEDKFVERMGFRVRNVKVTKNGKIIK